jgi:hypothetical protein
MPENEIIRRRSALLLDVTQAAAEVSRLVHEARDLNLPVEPGVRDGRDALIRDAGGGAALTVVSRLLGPEELVLERTAELLI